MLIRRVALCGAVFFIASARSAFAQSPEPAAPTAAPAATAAPQPDDRAVVYIYRYKQFVGSALEPSVYCDETELARMDNGRFFTVIVPAGRHVFRANDKQSGVVIDAQPGHRYFLRIELATGALKGHGRVVFVQPEQGEFEMLRLKPLGANKVRDTTRVSTEPMGRTLAADAPRR